MTAVCHWCACVYVDGLCMCMCLCACRWLCSVGVHVHCVRTVCCADNCQLHIHIDATICMLLNHHDYCTSTHSCLFRYTSTHRGHHTVHRMRHIAYGMYVCDDRYKYRYCEYGCADRMCELGVCICYMLMCSMDRLHRIANRYMCGAAYRISIIDVWLYQQSIHVCTHASLRL